MSKILVLNGSSYARAVEGLGKIETNRNEFLKNPDKFKLVLFTGGEDITPELYNDTSPEGICFNNTSRDNEEIEVYNVALENNVKMAGICRGMQFFNVMTGGRMIHHLERHVGGYHLMQTATDETIYVNSCHHQVILPARKTKVIGWTEQALSDIYIGERDRQIRYRGREIEAAIFPEIGAFGVQYHPEVCPKEFDMYLYFYNMVRYALTLPWDEFIKAYTVGTNVELFENVGHSSAAG